MPQERRQPDPPTEAGLPEEGPKRDHVPYARMGPGRARKVDAPEEDASAGGQGLSG